MALCKHTKKCHTRSQWATYLLIYIAAAGFALPSTPTVTSSVPARWKSTLSFASPEPRTIHSSLHPARMLQCQQPAQLVCSNQAQGTPKYRERTGPAPLKMQCKQARHFAYWCSSAFGPELTLYPEENAFRDRPARWGNSGRALPFTSSTPPDSFSSALADLRTDAVVRA